MSDACPWNPLWTQFHERVALGFYEAGFVNQSYALGSLRQLLKTINTQDLSLGDLDSIGLG